MSRSLRDRLERLRTQPGPVSEPVLDRSNGGQEPRLEPLEAPLRDPGELRHAGSEDASRPPRIEHSPGVPRAEGLQAWSTVDLGTAPGLDPAPVSESPLARLERQLLGDVGDGRPLRERLQRLANAVGSRAPAAPELRAGSIGDGGGARIRGSSIVRETPPPGAAGLDPLGRTLEELDEDLGFRGARRRIPIEELVQGCRIHNAHGEFFRVDEEAPLERHHGDRPLSRLLSQSPDALSLLTGDPSVASLDLSRVAFLDTETTGLSGGAGTAAFLVGLGFVEGDRFVVRQYFMRDYQEETALLAALAEDLERFEGIATFNGRQFDVPLLETRFRLNRLKFPLQDAPHLDLLHPARRLWKLRLSCCTLQNLEKALLGVERRGDVPGADVPHLWFRFIREGDARPMARVLQHNRLDILSLAALCALAGHWVSGGHPDDARDVWALARALDRVRAEERSEAAYRRAAEDEASPFRSDALLELARRARRKKATDQEAQWLERAAESGEPKALRALAIHLEHRRRDPEAALTVARRALDSLRAGEGDAVVAADLKKRLDRLQARLRKRRSAAPAASS